MKVWRGGRKERRARYMQYIRSVGSSLFPHLFGVDLFIQFSRRVSFGWSEKKIKRPFGKMKEKKKKGEERERRNVADGVA